MPPVNDEELETKDADELENEATSEEEAKVDDPNPMDEGHETEEEDDAKEAGTEHMVPKSRMDGALARARAAEAKLAELTKDRAQGEEMSKAEVTAAAKLSDSIVELETKLVDLDDQLEDARADGDAKVVSELRKQRTQLNQELRKAERSYAEVVAKEVSSKARDEAVDEVRFDAMASVLESTYPQLDPNSDSYDESVVDHMIRLRDAFIATGSKKSDALQEAASYVFPNGPTKKQLQGAADRKTNVGKNVDTARRQPPNMNDVGSNSNTGGAQSDLPDITKLTDEEFDALPEATKKRMRGDFG